MFEAAPPSPERRKKNKFESFGESAYESTKKMKQKKLLESQNALSELKEDDEEVKVEEKLVNALETLHHKCPRCGSSNIKQIENVKSDLDTFFCVDCRNKWEEK